MRLAVGSAKTPLTHGFPPIWDPSTYNILRPTPDDTKGILAKVT